MPCVRTRKEAAICAAITRATSNSASFHHLRTRSMTSESFAECRQNGKRSRVQNHLMNGPQHSAPTSALRQVQKGVDHTFQPLKKAALPVIRTASLDRPINQKRPAHDGVAVDESPIAAVEAVIAIVTHRKILSLWNDNLFAADVFLDLMRPFQDHWAGVQLIAHRRKSVIQRIVSRAGIVHYVRLGQ